jgi:chromosomal replication initiator protein
LGALLQLEVSSRVEGAAIDLARIRCYVSQRSGGRVPPSLREIAAVTARHFSLKVADLRSPCHRRAVVTARGVAMYLARTLTRQSLKQIGRYFGGRDHTTVSYGCSSTEKLLETEPAIREAVEQLQQRLRVA